MNKPRKSLILAECKTQASILLKLLRSSDLTIAKKAAKRFQRLPEFANVHLEEIIQAEIKRKHALAVIALEKGFPTWADLKWQVNLILGGFLNKWFAHYAEAKAHLQAEGGYLLPYKNQFFICEANYIAQLGLDPHDPDWQLIHYDWAMPSNQAAGQRLLKKWIAIQGGKHE